jgi:hypothetical protein
MKQTLLLSIFLLTISHFVKAQSLLINTDTVYFSSSITLPYWVPAGSTIKILDSVNSISVIEFKDSANTLIYSRAISISKTIGQQTVSSGKTWKIEAIGLKFAISQNSGGGSSGGGGFGASVTSVTKSINSVLPTILTSPKTFNSAGTYSWTVPTGVTNICIEVWGSGGQGGNLRSTSSYMSTGIIGFGGGGGGYGYQCFNVVPGTTYQVTVGSSGGSSSVGNLISATGGTDGTDAAGGVGGTSTATFNYSGYRSTNGHGGAVAGYTGGTDGAPGQQPQLRQDPYNSSNYYYSGGVAATKPGGGGAVSLYGADGRVIIYW